MTSASPTSGCGPPLGADAGWAVAKSAAWLSEQARASRRASQECSELLKALQCPFLTIPASVLERLADRPPHEALTDEIALALANANINVTTDIMKDHKDLCGTLSEVAAAVAQLCPVAVAAEGLAVDTEGGPDLTTAESLTSDGDVQFELLWEKLEQLTDRLQPHWTFHVQGHQALIPEPSLPIPFEPPQN